MVVRSFASAPGLAIAELGNGTKQAIQSILAAFNVEAKVEIINKTTLVKTRKTFKLVTLTADFYNEYNVTKTRLGSAKIIGVNSDCRALIGFDLDDNFEMSIDDDNKKIKITTRYPTALSLESSNIRQVGDSGWWNGVKDEDRNSALAEARYMAERRANQWEFKVQALDNFKSRCFDAVKGYGFSVEVIAVMDREYQ